MGEVAATGRTVLFVSHNLAAIQQLTSHAVLLDRGHLLESGTSADVVAHYLEQSEGRAEIDLRNARRWDERVVREIELVEAEPIAAGSIFSAEQDLSFRIRLRANAQVDHYQVVICVYQFTGAPVGTTWTLPLSSFKVGTEIDLEVRIPDLRLGPSRYFLAIGTGVGYGQRGHLDYDGVVSVCDFEVTPSIGEGGTLTYWNPAWGPGRFPQLGVERRSIS